MVRHRSRDFCGCLLPSGSFDGENWTLTYPSVASDSTLNSFITNGSAMNISDWGGLGTVTGDLIHILDSGTVSISGVGTTVSSGLAFNASAEGFQWFYSLNSDSENAFGSVGEGFGGSDVGDGVDLSASVSNLSVSPGDTLVVGFRINVNGADDGAAIRSLTVNLTPSSVVPEPSTAMTFGLLAAITPWWRRRRQI